MTPSDVDRTDALRDWLAVGSDDLSPRVRERVLHDFPLLDQAQPHWAGPAAGMSFIAGAGLGAAAVVAAVAVMLGAGLFGGSSPGGTGATPAASSRFSSATGVSSPAASPRPSFPIDYAYRDVGFVGLPRRGAIPSNPTRTELIEEFWRPQHSGLPPYSGKALLYADGRLIWNEYYWDPPVTGPFRTTGWLEQTLSQEGIELVRALATGRVRTLGGSISPRLLDPAQLPARLPIAAWVDHTVRPYVPSGFGACLVVQDAEDPFAEASMSLPEMLDALPQAAADLLQGRSPVPKDAYDANTHCPGLDLVDARRLEAALREAGLEQDERRNGFLLQYHMELEQPDGRTWLLEVWFEPILPDGSVTCSSCG